MQNKLLLFVLSLVIAFSCNKHDIVKSNEVIYDQQLLKANALTWMDDQKKDNIDQNIFIDSLKQNAN